MQTGLTQACQSNGMKANGEGRRWCHLVGFEYIGSVWECVLILAIQGCRSKDCPLSRRRLVSFGTWAVYGHVYARSFEVSRGWIP
jgi:hypothetical protein